MAEKEEKEKETKKCKLHLPKCIQPRHYVWYTVFLLGLPTGVGFCLYYGGANPDKEVYWGKIPIEARQELFATRELADAAGATDVWNIHLIF